MITMPILRFAGGLVALCALFILLGWISTENINTAALIRLGTPFADHPAAPLIIAVAYVAASFILLPRPILTLASILIFGPWQTAVFGLAGLLVAAAAAFWIGRLHGLPRVLASTNPALNTIATKLKGGGIYSVVVIRMLPIAPYTIVNLFAGTLGIRFSDFLIGSFIGMIPGMLSTVVLGDRLLVALRNFNWANLGIAIGIAAACTATSLLLRRSVKPK
jgi:phospholipase D1/2